MAPEDILDTLCDCIKNNRKIKEIDGKIYLGGRCFAKTLETFPVRLSQGKKNMTKSRKFYNLEEVCFFLQNQRIPPAQYMKIAQSKKIKHVSGLDRKQLIDRIGGNSKLNAKATSLKRLTQKSSVSTMRVAHHYSQTQEATSALKNQNADKTTNESEKSKPHLRTYSRKRSTHDLRPSSRRQSSASEDQPTDMVLTVSSNELADELTFLKNENVNLERSLKSMASFLKDHFGVTDDQLEAIQEIESNTIDLNNIASQIKNNIVHASVLLESNSSSQMDLGVTKYCYKAVKHPTCGWVMSKEELSSVLSGFDDDKVIPQWEDLHAPYVDECLALGSTVLKRAFSVLISQMREYNKPPSSPKDSDVFFKKVIEDCLTEAVDSFRDLFLGFIPLEKEHDGFVPVEKWVDVSRAELGKIFHSLALTLQSLRDIPANQQKQPISLFHFPEPTFSLALNPAKVTHSVVLEMYVKIGLAELRRILMHIVGSSPDILSSNFSSNHPSRKPNNNYENKDTLNMKQAVLNESVGEPREQCQSPVFETSSQSLSTTLGSHEHKTMSPFEYMKTLTHEKKDAHFSSRSSVPPSFYSGSPSQEIDGVFFHRNGGSRHVVKRNSAYQTRRSSKSVCQQYSKFKASIGNTLVSSFKKQIQEKIQASSTQL